MTITSPNEPDECDACPHCRDTCDNVDSCVSCQKKLNALNLPASRRPETSSSWFRDALSAICPSSDSRGTDDRTSYTMCQLRRHNHANSAWILVGHEIYDATPYIRSHPGGMEAIMRKCGGVVDCTADLQFHSKRAQKEWRKFKIGTLCRCSNSH